jgi:hypothetical protein
VRVHDDDVGPRAGLPDVLGDRVELALAERVPRRHVDPHRSRRVRVDDGRSDDRVEGNERETDAVTLEDRRLARQQLVGGRAGGRDAGVAKQMNGLDQRPRPEVADVVVRQRQEVDPGELESFDHLRAGHEARPPRPRPGVPGDRPLEVPEREVGGGEPFPDRPEGRVEVSGGHHLGVDRARGQHVAERDRRDDRPDRAGRRHRDRILRRLAERVGSAQPYRAHRGGERFAGDEPEGSGIARHRGGRLRFGRGHVDRGRSLAEKHPETGEPRRSGRPDHEPDRRLAPVERLPSANGSGDQPVGVLPGEVERRARRMDDEGERLASGLGRRLDRCGRPAV